MPVNLPFRQKKTRWKSAVVVTLRGLSSNAAVAAFYQTSARKKKKEKEKSGAGREHSDGKREKE